MKCWDLGSQVNASGKRFHDRKLITWGFLAAEGTDKAMMKMKRVEKRIEEKLTFMVVMEKLDQR